MPRRLTGHVTTLSKREHLLVVNLPCVITVDDDGNEHRRYPKTQRPFLGGARAANDALQAWIDELSDAGQVDRDALTVKALLARWRAGIKHDVRPATLERYRQLCEHQLDPALGKMLADQVTRADLSKLYADLAAGEHPPSERTVLHVHRAIHRAYEWALEEEPPLVEHNPAARVRRPRSPDHRERPVWNDAQVVAAVRLAEGTRMELPLMLAAWCGLRRSEICGLRWDAVCLETGIIAVRASLEQTPPSDEVPDGLHLLPPKSRAGYRECLAPSPLVAALERVRKQTVAATLAAGGKLTGYVCCRRDGSPMRPGQLSSSWRAFQGKHKLEPGIPFHALRHSYATAMYHGGTNVKTLQGLLGHSTPAITEHLYVHAIDEARASALAAQEERIAAAVSRADSQLIRDERLAGPDAKT